MWPYLARRLLVALPLLIGVSFVTHLLIELAPGDYFTRLAEDPTLSEAYLARLRSHHGLDGGVLYRYWRWLHNALCLDFGHSFRFNAPVSTLIAGRLVNTLLLTVSALVVSWTVAIPLGVLAAVYQGRLLDRCIGFVAFFGLSIPRVFFALLMVMFAATTGWFPTGGMRDVVFWDDFGVAERVLDVAHHLVLPTVVIATTELAAYVRQMRAEMIEIQGKTFVRAARAKGLPAWRVVLKHTLPNALNPLITLFGYSLASLLTGSFLVEWVFGWPGLARLTVEAVLGQDEPVVMASVVMATVMLVVGNLLADLLLALVDPRVRFGQPSP